MQLDFLDISTPLKNEAQIVSWSPSKMNTAKQCSRRLYYQYFGSKKTKAKNEPHKERLQYLAKLSNKALVAGEIAHSVIATYFRKAKVNEVWNVDRLKNFARHILQQTVEFSKNEKNGIHRVLEYPPSILKEIFYCLEPESAVMEEILAKLNSNFTNFINSSLFRHLLEGGKQFNSIIEEKAKFELVPGIKVDGVIDLAFTSTDNFQIVDWKTGKADEEDTSLQLLTYAIWASQSKKVTTESIRIEKAYLGANRLEPLEYSEVHVARAKARIIQDAEILKELNDFGVEGNYQAFSKCGKKKICYLCPFEEVCEKSK